MSTLRKDPLTHNWVIFAPESRIQTFTFANPKSDLPPEKCPLCPGNELMTQTEVAAVRPANSKKDAADWTLRVVPNLHAVLHMEGKLERRGEGLYDLMNGIGAHEVLIESRCHDTQLQDLPMEQLQAILIMYRERMTSLLLDSRFRHLQIFRNQGLPNPMFGPHPHSQVLALPIIPRPILDQLRHTFEYFQIKERCIFCDMLSEDHRRGRVVFENGEFVSLIPFAAKFPFETWIMPKDHYSDYRTLPDSRVGAFAEVLKTTLKAFIQAVGGNAYNYMLYTSPSVPPKTYHTHRAKISDHFHWHLKLIPRTQSSEGFEATAGLYVNPMFPEDAAARLRELLPRG